jgi:hypothetical protein
MKISRIIALILISLILTGTMALSQLNTMNSSITYNIRAKSADSFVESMGINTKFGYCPGRLCDNYPEVRDLLAQLGIRYIRDIPYPESWRIRTDLYRDFGVRMLAEIVRTWGEPLAEEAIEPQLSAIKKWGKTIAGIVGVNEYDNPVYQACSETEGCDPNWSENNWPRQYEQFQRRLYRAVKSDRALRDLPVVLAPLAHLDNLERLTDLSDSCDRGNDHSYPGAWGKPSQESGWGEKSNARTLDEIVAKVQKVCSDKKLWITETGYEEADGQPNPYSVSRQAKAKYLPRIYANYFQQGIEKTFLYELIEPTEDGTGFGIVDLHLQPTPAYFAIKNLIALLSEATWDRDRQVWNYPPNNTTFLKYTLTGDRHNLEHLLLQKSDGTFYLLIWQEIYVYDNQLNKNIINPERMIQFKLNNATIERAKTYLLDNPIEPSAVLSSQNTWNDLSTITLAVPDRILVLEFTAKSYK